MLKVAKLIKKKKKQEFLMKRHPEKKDRYKENIKKINEKTKKTLEELRKYA